jgi:hypothetical protein
MGCNNSKDNKSKAVEQEKTQQPQDSSPALASDYRGAKLFKRSDFTVENFIQEGGQGKVYVGRENETEKLFALKVSKTVCLFLKRFIVLVN